MAIIQNTHLQPRFSATYPPAIGPTTGPSKGPIAQIAMIHPLFSCEIKSAMLPPPRTRGVEPTHPSKKWNATSMPRLLLMAQAIVKTTNDALET